MLEEGMQVFVDEPAIYEPRGDYIVSKWKGQEYVIPISIAQKIVAGLGKALDRWHEGRSEVIPIRARH